jgi:hypothetical protein
MSSLLALGCLLPSVALAGAPLDVKATFGEQVAKDLDTLVELRPGPGVGRGHLPEGLHGGRCCSSRRAIP